MQDLVSDMSVRCRVIDTHKPMFERFALYQKCHLPTATLVDNVQLGVRLLTFLNLCLASISVTSSTLHSPGLLAYKGADPAPTLLGILVSSFVFR